MRAAGLEGGFDEAGAAVDDGEAPDVGGGRPSGVAVGETAVPDLGRAAQTIAPVADEGGLVAGDPGWRVARHQRLVPPLDRVELELFLENTLCVFVQRDHQQTGGGFVDAVDREGGATGDARDHAEDGQVAVFAVARGDRQEAGGLPDHHHVFVAVDDGEVAARLDPGGVRPEDHIGGVDVATAIGGGDAREEDLARFEGAASRTSAEALVTKYSRQTRHDQPANRGDTRGVSLMQWMTHFVPRADPREMVRTFTTALQGPSPHLVLMFASPGVAASLDVLQAELVAQLGDAVAVLGCSGQGLAVDGREHEDADGVVFMAAHLPDVGVVPFFVTPDQAHTRTTEEWRATLDLIPEQQPVFVLLSDPFSVDGQALVDGLDAAFPGCPKAGGLASGGAAPGAHHLVCNQHFERAGAVGVALWGDIRMATLVAQGARAIGPVLRVTEANGPAILGLDDRPVLPALEALFGGLSQEDRMHFQQAPAVGLAPVDDATGSLRGHDFLVRNMLGFKRSENALMIGANVQVGDRIQLRVRDASSADQELRELADRLARSPHTASPAGALMFTCLGRGQRFFGVPDHDVSVVRGRLGSPPLAGFFCNGELGPVRGRTWLHGYTCSVALFSPRGWS